MILTGHAIQKNVEKGRITLEPFDVGAINPNSYNYHLGAELLVLEPGEVAPGSRYRRIQIPREGYMLQPGRLYLGQTFEKIGSRYYTTTLIGRSTMGRLGLWLQVTADLGHIGAEHHWTLEMKVVQPLRLYAGMPIGQVSFWRNFGRATQKYSGKYAADTKPQTSKQ